jgi:hypothetical protein
MKKNYTQHIFTAVLGLACIGLIIMNMMPRDTVYDEVVVIPQSQVNYVILDVPIESAFSATVDVPAGKRFDFAIWTKEHYMLVRDALDRPSAAAFEAVAEQDAKPLQAQNDQTAVALNDLVLPPGKYVIEVANVPEYDNGDMTTTMLYKLKRK